MQPLLRVQNIPISIEYKVQRASLQHSSRRPEVNISRERGQALIQATPARVQIDTYESRASAGLKSAPRSVQEYADAGRAAAYEATRNYAEQGNTMIDSHGKGDPIADIAASKAISTVETILAFIPSVPPDISVQEGSISFDYSADKLNFNWDTSTRVQMDFVPANIEFTVTQYPQVIIEYIGDPIYVPPSAAPDYKLDSAI